MTRPERKPKTPAAENCPIERGITLYTYRLEPYRCTHCDWSGHGDALNVGNMMKQAFELNCPRCRKFVTYVPYPDLTWAISAFARLPPDLPEGLSDQELRRAVMEYLKLASPEQLPEVVDIPFEVTWDIAGFLDLGMWTVLSIGEEVLFCEPAYYECHSRFSPVAGMLRAKYGDRLKDIRPTERAWYYLLGDSFSAGREIDAIRCKLRGTPADASGTGGN